MTIHSPDHPAAPSGPPLVSQSPAWGLRCLALADTGSAGVAAADDVALLQWGILPDPTAASGTGTRTVTYAWSVPSRTEPGQERGQEPGQRYLVIEALASDLGTRHTGYAVSCDCPAGRDQRPCQHIGLLWLREFACLERSLAGVASEAVFVTADESAAASEALTAAEMLRVSVREKEGA